MKMKELTELKDLEARLNKLAPELKTKPFFERTQLDDKVAQILTAVSMCREELEFEPQHDSAEFAKGVIKEAREIIEGLLEEEVCADTERSPEL